jgi:tRNA-modifying protein YgfZ
MNVQSFSPQLLANRTVLRVAGEGALAFLHNLLTADLSAAMPCYGALLSPQGKILHDVFVVPSADAVWIDVAAAQADALLKRLKMYRLRAKLEIDVEAGKSVCVGRENGLPGLAYADPRLADLGFRSISDVAALPPGSGYDAARMALGIADSDLDIGSGELFVHEANLDQLHGVAFNKGCYVGQEVVSRTHHRHSARNRILPVSADQRLRRGDEIMAGSLRVGTVLSWLGTDGLALVRLDRLAEATSMLLTGDVKVQVHKPHWARFDVVIPEVVQ